MGILNCPPTHTEAKTITIVICNVHYLIETRHTYTMKLFCPCKPNTHTVHVMQIAPFTNHQKGIIGIFMWRLRQTRFISMACNCDLLTT